MPGNTSAGHAGGESRGEWALTRRVGDIAVRKYVQTETSMGTCWHTQKKKTKMQYSEQ